MPCNFADYLELMITSFIFMTKVFMVAVLILLIDFSIKLAAITVKMIKKFPDYIKQGTKYMVEYTKDFIKKIPKLLWEVFTKMVMKILEPIIGPIKKAIEVVSEGIGKAIDAVIGPIKSSIAAIKKIVDFLNPGKKIADGAKKAGKWVKKLIRK